jgi:hypothetical protein
VTGLRGILPTPHRRRRWELSKAQEAGGSGELQSMRTPASLRASGRPWIPKIEACRSPGNPTPPWIPRNPAPELEDADATINPKNRTLHSPGLGFVVGRRIHASTPWDRERSMGRFRDGGRAALGNRRDWPATVAGTHGGEEEEVGMSETGRTGRSAGGLLSSGEKMRGGFCKNTVAQLISGRREYFNFVFQIF